MCPCTCCALLCSAARAQKKQQLAKRLCSTCLVTRLLGLGFRPPALLYRTRCCLQNAAQLEDRQRGARPRTMLPQLGPGKPWRLKEFSEAATRRRGTEWRVVSQARACWAVQQHRAAWGSSPGTWALAVAASEAARGARGASVESGTLAAPRSQAKGGSSYSTCGTARWRARGHPSILIATGVPTPERVFGFAPSLSWAASRDDFNQYMRYTEALLLLLEPAWASVRAVAVWLLEALTLRAAH